MAFFPGHPGKAGTGKAEPFWILMRQEMMGWPALVAEWVKPLAAVHTGQGSLPVRVEA